MWQIFLGSLALSLIHALIPHHWLPLIAISKTEKWTTRETLFATFVTGLSHMASTIIIGIVVGFVGIKLSESYSELTKIAAPSILLAIGLIFLFMDLFSKKHHHHHFDIKNDKSKRSKTAIITSLSVAMFLAPCIEIEIFYFQAAIFGWLGIFVVSAVYLVATLLFLFALVYWGLKGVNRFNFTFFEKYAKSFTGIILIILGIIAYFVEF